MNAAFDVGADDGFHGILFAFFNPKISVFAFEPIKGSKKEILRNLRKMILNKATKLLNDPYRSKVLQGGLFQAILAAKKHYKKRCPKRCPKLLRNSFFL